MDGLLAQADYLEAMLESFAAKVFPVAKVVAAKVPGIVAVNEKAQVLYEDAQKKMKQPLMQEALSALEKVSDDDCAEASFIAVMSKDGMEQTIVEGELLELSERVFGLLVVKVAQWVESSYVAWFTEW